MRYVIVKQINEYIYIYRCIGLCIDMGLYSGLVYTMRDAQAVVARPGQAVVARPTGSNTQAARDL